MASAAAGLGAGLVWLVAYGMPGGSAAAVSLAAHAVVGAGLGLVAGRFSPRPVWAAAALAGAFLLGAPPVAQWLDALVAGRGRGARAAVLLAGAVVLLGFGLACLRWRVGRALLLAFALGAPAAILSLARLDPTTAAPIALPRLEAAAGPLARVAVIGVDGADWSVIDPMLERGELPHLASLVERGVHGVLRSVDPMYSPVVWTSIFSGATPEEHGIRGWYDALATNRRVPLLWELVGAAGGRSVVLNVPGTWPPRAFPGVLVSGFPMPQLVVADASVGGQFVGWVLAQDGARTGVVPARRLAGGRADVEIGQTQVVALGPARHWLIETARRRRWLGGATGILPVQVEGSLADPGPLDLVLGGLRTRLAPGDWSDWIDLRIGEQSAFLRVRRLADGSLYLTPPFQSPAAPRFPIVAGALEPRDFAPDGRYVVEGAGWKAAADPDLRDAVFEHLVHVHELQSRAAERLVARDWRLFAFVFTLTDRVQHGYWPYHDPEPFGDLVSPADRERHGERVRDAYREVDRGLGRLLEQLGDGVAVVLASDHGAAPDLERGVGGHREEGLFVAAGPGIEPSSVRLDLSLYDLAPTLLAGLGLPVADDLAGRIRHEIFAGPPFEVRRIASYGHVEASTDPARIDRSTEEQLRALGYVE